PSNIMLRKAFYSWLNMRGNYFYIKNLVELFVFSELANESEYTAIKKKVYLYRNGLKMPFFIWLGDSFLRSMEPFVFFRRLISWLYSKVHYVYVKQLEDYLKGHIPTNDEREGRIPLLSK
ncbi:MAG: hypothetical protein ABIA04_08195, partial [Pseudomonadota bacterium]